MLQVSMGPQIQYPTLQTFHERFEEQARLHPQRLAVATPSQQLSYEELNSQANRLAHWLLAHTSDAHPFIALAPEREAFMLIALLAILKAGKAYLPLDPQLPPARLLSQLQ